MKQMLYTASLERHMDTYFQGVRLDDYNQQYQLAQMRIVRESELMQLSQAEIQYKLEQLKTAMATNLKKTVLEGVVDNIVENIAPVAIESKPSPTKKTTSPKAMIPGLAEAIANPKLKKTPTKQPKFKEKSPMAIQIEEAKGSPSSISAAKRRRASTPSTPGTPPFSDSPTSSEAPTESTSTTAQPSSPPKDKKLTPINFQKEKAIVTAMIKGLDASNKIASTTRAKLLADLKKITGKGATKDLNAFSSELMAKYDLDSGPKAFRDKRREVLEKLDEVPNSNPGGALSSVMTAKNMEDLNSAIGVYNIPVLQGSGLKPKSKSKVSKRKV